jgi:hypothetical protein
MTVRNLLVRMRGRDAPEVVVGLTERYQELRRQAFRDAVDLTIELGQIVIDVHARLREGFGAWLDEVGTTERTARNYVALARLAAEAPGIVQRWKELGPSKLYKVATLPAPARSKVLRKADGEKLLKATDEEFAAIVAPYSTQGRRVTAEMRAHGMRMKVQAWAQQVKSARLSGIEDAAKKAELRAEIASLVRALEALARSL